MNFTLVIIVINLFFINLQFLTAHDSLEKVSYDLAQKQLDAYNSKNLEEFLSVYSDDVEVYSFPDSLIYIGKEKMRNVYKTFFDKSPEVICRLISRMVNGKYVIDQEYISNHYSGIDFEAVAIYEIKDGLIARVWFLPRNSSYQK